MFFLPENVETFYFRYAWPLSTLFVLIAAALFVSALIYVREQTLALWKRILMGGVRAVIFVLVLLLLFEPVGARGKKTTQPGTILVLVDISKSMAFADQRVGHEQVAEAALALNKMKLSATAVPEDVIAEVARTPRIKLAQGVLSHPDFKVFHEPGDKYRLGFFSFGERLEAAPEEPEKYRAWLKELVATAPATHLGEALQQAVDRYSGQPIAALVLLSDGANNAGIDALEAARSLHTPVYPLPIGLPRPEDVRIITMTTPDAVFPKDKVPVQVQLASSPRFVKDKQKATIFLKNGAEVLDRKTVVLQDSQFVDLTFVPQQTGGLVKLDVSIAPLPNEATDENNHATRTVKIIDEKIRVLYVEGKPRWEYRYLRAVLQRDHRLITKFLLTEGDPDLAKASDQYIAKLPEDEASTFKYDLVILGEVKADYFTRPQQEWLEKLVRDKGGSLLMLAGQQLAPTSYADTPIANLLPVKLPAGGGREYLDAKAHPVPTAAGLQSAIMQLEPAEEDNVDAWKLVKPLYDLPRLAGVKPAATVLATLSTQGGKAEPYPLIAWQRFGSGKCMFVGSDQLWRLRFKRGDQYHAHFWSQAIQFLTLSRLLGENKRIRLETDRKLYVNGDRVLIQASLLDEEYLPLKKPSYPVVIEQVPPKGEPRQVLLFPVPNREGIYQGYFNAEQSGNFQVRPLTDEKDANRPNFQVEYVSRENLELEAQHEQLRKLAETTGGKLLTVRDLADLHTKLPDQSRQVVLPPQEMELWDNWWLFALLLGLCGTEWFLRRSNDIA